MTFKKNVFRLFRALGPTSGVAAATIEVGGVAIDVVRKNIRNIHLRVCPPDGSVRISAPLRMDLEVIRSFATSRVDWVRKHQQRMRERPQPMPLEYLEGESHYLWGSAYRLQVRETTASAQVALSDGRLILEVRAGTSRRKKQAMLDAWYRARLLEALPELAGKWERLTGVKAGRYSARKMRTRWGSCNPRTGHIRLNSELAKKPRECLEYVLVHELTHVLEPSHNHRFKALMDRFMPEWRGRRAELKEEGGRRKEEG
jgi:predicted metal-dependent hydrolase